MELGAGCGVVSAVCAALGAAEVVATDAKDLLPLLRMNVERWQSESGLRNLKVWFEQGLRLVLAWFEKER